MWIFRDTLWKWVKRGNILEVRLSIVVYKDTDYSIESAHERFLFTILIYELRCLKKKNKK